MYAALWRVLPGPAWLRVTILVLAVAALLTACVLWIFPWIQDMLPQPDVTVDGT